MLSRFLLGLFGLMLAAALVRRFVIEARRAGARLRDAETAPSAVRRLKEDPRTGIYYPAD